MNKKIYITLLLNLISFPIYADGIDCDRANTLAEMSICGDKALAAKDYNLQRLYEEAMIATDDKAELKNSQLKWLKERDACKVKNCIDKAYEERIDALENIANKLSGFVSPASDLNYPVRWNSTASSFYFLYPTTLKNESVKKFLKESISSKRSYFIDFNLGENTLALIPPPIGYEAFNKTGTFTNAPDIIDKTGNIDWGVLSHTISFIYTGQDQAIEFCKGKNIVSLTVAAYGDYNHDGYEDILLQEDVLDTEYQLKGLNYYVLTRFADGEKLQIIKNAGHQELSSEYEAADDNDIPKNYGCSKN